MTNTNTQRTSRRGFLKKAGAVVALGLLGKCAYDSAERTAQMEFEIKPLAVYDLNGDGRLDYLVEAPGSTALPNHYSLGWYDGNKVRVEKTVTKDVLGNDVVHGKYFARGFSQPVSVPTHIRYSENPSELRFHNVELSQDGKDLEIVVADNTPDFPVTVSVYRGAIMRNPKYKGDIN